MAENNDVQVFDTADVEANKVIAVLMLIFPFLFFLPLVMEDKKNSAYLRFFANQALILLIGEAIASILAVIIIGGVLALILLVFAIMEIVAAVNGEGKKMPLIGGISMIK